MKSATLEARRPDSENAIAIAIAARKSARLPSVDGLRGVAAVVVLLYHLSLVAGPVLRRDNGTGVGSVMWWVSQTPLKLMAAGSEAVLVFFILSGLVVSLPALKSARFSWSAFLSGRLARLYLPVWASIGLGALCVWMIPRNHSAVGKGTWMDVSQATWVTVATQASLTRISYSLNNVLWSLRWELLFCVLLPVFVALALATARWWAIVLTVALALTTIGVLTGIDALRYFPVFFIGTVMAVRLDTIRAGMRRRTHQPHARLWATSLTVGALVLLIGHWMLRPLVEAHTLLGTILAQLSVLGATGVVLVAIGVPPVRLWLEAPVVQWLGKVSFSLYLIHIPVLATLTFVFGQDRWWLVAIIGVPVALLLAWAFNRVAEIPSHRLAHLISSTVSKKQDAHHAKCRQSEEVTQI